MKKLSIILIACLLLAGCSARETFETVEDEFGQQQIAAPRQMLLTLPENAAVQTVQSNGGGLKHSRLNCGDGGIVFDRVKRGHYNVLGK